MKSAHSCEIGIKGDGKKKVTQDDLMVQILDACRDERHRGAKTSHSRKLVFHFPCRDSAQRTETTVLGSAPLPGRRTCEDVYAMPMAIVHFPIKYIKSLEQSFYYSIASTVTKSDSLKSLNLEAAEKQQSSSILLLHMQPA